DDMEINYHRKSMKNNKSTIHEHNINRRHFHIELLNDQHISCTEYVRLNASDIKLCMENEMKLLQNNNNEAQNELEIDWIKTIDESPENIEPILEYFGSNNKRQQSVNIK
ncbi:unnamed protein product, partial [Schistosoma turkestanicum]